MKKTLLLTLVTVLFSLTLAACGDTSTSTIPPNSTASTDYSKIPATGGYLTTIQERGRLIIGTVPNNPGFAVKNTTTGQLEGFDADIAREFARILLGDATKVDFIELISPNRIPALQQDSVDLVISTMTITEARKQQIDFSNVYYQAGQSLLVRKNSPIKGITDLPGKSVCTVRDTTSEKGILEKAPQATLRTLTTYPACVNQLELGVVDAVTTDDVILFGFKLEKPDKFDIVGGQFTQEPYGIGVKKGRPELLKFVNDVVGEMKKNGRWQTFYDKHIKPATGATASPPQ